MTVHPAQTPHKSRRWFWRPQVVLIHATVSRTAKSALNWFENPESGVSADFVIDKDGTVYRPVPKGWYSWHAGACLFRGKLRRDYNRISYGVELVNLNDGVDPYPEAQLEAMAHVIRLCKDESPSVLYVRRHADVGFPRGRKSDPAGLSISDIYTAIQTYEPLLWMD